jgi:hypothetical protein
MAWPLCHCGRCVGKECSRQRARQGDLYIGSWRPRISDQHLGEIYLPLASENEPEAETGFQKKVSENTGSWGSSGDFKSRVTWFLDARSHSRRKGTKQGARVHPPAPASSLSRCNLHLPTPWQLASHLPCSLPAGSSVDHPRQTVRASHSRRALSKSIDNSSSKSSRTSICRVAGTPISRRNGRGIDLGHQGLGHSPQQWKRGQGTTGTEREGSPSRPAATPICESSLRRCVLSQTKAGLKPATNHLTRRQIHIAHSHQLQTTEISSSTRPPRTSHRLFELGKRISALSGTKRKNSRNSEDYH